MGNLVCDDYQAPLPTEANIDQAKLPLVIEGREEAEDAGSGRPIGEKAQTGEGEVEEEE